MKVVHLQRGTGVSCGADESWRSRNKPRLTLALTTSAGDVTCKRCLATYAGKCAAGARS